ncbi:MAG: pitrilysin family protein [bacterium]
MSLLFPCLAQAQELKAVSPGSRLIGKMRIQPIKVNLPRVGAGIERVVLPNGMILFLREDHTLPLITADAVIRTGTLYEKKEEHGVSRLTGTLLRTGGTATLPPEEVNRRLEYMGAEIETSIGMESGTASLDVLSGDFEKAFPIFAEILMKPAFSQEKLELARGQIKEGLRRRNDDPFGVSQREFNKIIYGDHPCGWELTWDVVKNITRDDIIRWHERYFHPNNVMLALCGDFKSDEMIARISDTFRDWKKADLDLPAVPNVPDASPSGVFIVEKDLTQTYIRMGHLGVARNNPDQYAISLMNYILGGGSFNSRIMQKVRSDEGLAYSCSSRFSTNTRERGTFEASCQTKGPTTHRAAALIKAEIERIMASPVTDSELAWAKDSYSNSFVFTLAPPRRMLINTLLLEYQGMPSDYYQNYLDNIRKVTRADILRVAKTYLHPGAMAILLVGKPSSFEKSFEDLGAVNIIKLTEFPEIEK